VMQFVEWYAAAMERALGGAPDKAEIAARAERVKVEA
jgi:hypothetical protein